MTIRMHRLARAFSAAAALPLAALLLPGCSQNDSSTAAGAGSSSLPAAARGVPGHYDGTWQVMSAGVSLDPSSETPSGCGSIEIKFQVSDSQVKGGLKRT